MTDAITMTDEKMMDDERPQTDRSESAFSWTSDGTQCPNDNVATEITEQNLVLLTNLLEKPLRATKYMRSFALLIPQRIIPVHERDDVIEVTIARASEPTNEYSLYTTHLPGYTHAYLDLFQLSASYGELFFVRRVHLYQREDIVEDYNASKPAGLANTALDSKIGLRMIVGGRPVDLKPCRLRAYQGQAVLDTELGAAGQVKIVKSISEFKLRLGDHSPIVSMNQIRGGVVLSYSRTAHDRVLHRRTVVDSDNAALTEAGLPFHGTLVLSAVERPSNGRDCYVFKADLATMLRISRALTSMGEDLDVYRETKGLIAEAIVKQLMPELGAVMRKDHPLTPVWWPATSKRPGPDFLVQIELTGELAYVEVKWWDKTNSALKDASVQVLNDLDKHPIVDGVRVTAGYVAIIGWDMDSEVFQLQFRRASSSAKNAVAV